MKVTLVSHTANPEYLAGSAAAICYNGKNPARSLKIAMDGGHESVLEHVSFTFLVEDVSRVLLAQLTRHRLASYSVQSQRYCGVEGCTVITPETVREHMWHGPFSQAVAECFRLYSQMVAEGVPEEDARYIIPQGVTCQLLVTMNARELRHFFALRCCNRAQWEIRQLAREMLQLCKEAAPAIFADAGAGCVRGACPEGTKSCISTHSPNRETIQEKQRVSHTTKGEKKAD